MISISVGDVYEVKSTIRLKDVITGVKIILTTNSIVSIIELSVFRTSTRITVKFSRDLPEITYIVASRAISELVSDGKLTSTMIENKLTGSERSSNDHIVKYRLKALFRGWVSKLTGPDIEGLLKLSKISPEKFGVDKLNKISWADPAYTEIAVDVLFEKIGQLP